MKAFAVTIWKLTRGSAILVILAILADACGRGHEHSATPLYPNAPVILISVDTLRADHLPAYGYKGVATPNLDALRSESTLFRNAYASAPLTLPSHLTMLTGLLPPQAISPFPSERRICRRATLLALPSAARPR